MPLYSFDIHRSKLPLIEDGAKRLSIDIIEAGLQNAKQPRAKLKRKVDFLLCDVPCSGYGIIRKKPDIRYKDPDTMQQLPALQLEILCNQARYVKKGGLLIYSTCTLNKRENEEVVERFLAENPDFCLKYVKAELINGKYEPKLLKNEKLPTLIITGYDQIAYGAMKYAREIGLKIPEDISFVGVDDVTAASYFDVPLTSIHLGYEKVCGKICDLLFSKIENRHLRMKEKITVPVTVSIRKSIKKLK